MKPPLPREAAIRTSSSARAGPEVRRRRPGQPVETRLRGGVADVPAAAEPAHARENADDTAPDIPHGPPPRNEPAQGARRGQTGVQRRGRLARRHLGQARPVPVAGVGDVNDVGDEAVEPARLRAAGSRSLQSDRGGGCSAPRAPRPRPAPPDLQPRPARRAGDRVVRPVPRKPTGPGPVIARAPRGRGPVGPCRSARSVGPWIGGSDPSGHRTVAVSGHFTPVSSSESVHSRRAAAGSLAAALRPTRAGAPRISAGPSGPT